MRKLRCEFNNLLAILLFLSLVGIAAAAKSEKTGEIILFDGKSTNGWTSADGGEIGKGWKVEDGVLVRTKRAGHIYAENPYENFELEFEWKLAKKGNSGVKYCVAFFEKGLWGRPGWLGFEYQLYDDAKLGNPNSVSSTAALYALYQPSEEKKLNPPDEYNHSKIVVCGDQIEHWLNGKMVLKVDRNSDEWQKHIAGSKFAKVTGFGQNRKGRIMIQDHGAQVWFRKMVLRPIEDE